MQERVLYPDPEDLKHSLLSVLNPYLKVVLTFPPLLRHSPTKQRCE